MMGFSRRLQVTGSHQCDFGVRHVTVCSVLHRTYPHDINKEIDAYNNVLRHFCDVEGNIDYHTHRVFWRQGHYQRCSG